MGIGRVLVAEPLKKNCGFPKNLPPKVWSLYEHLFNLILTKRRTKTRMLKKIDTQKWMKFQVIHLWKIVNFEWKQKLVNSCYINGGMHSQWCCVWLYRKIHTRVFWTMITIQHVIKFVKPSIKLHLVVWWLLRVPKTLVWNLGYDQNLQEIEPPFPANVTGGNAKYHARLSVHVLYTSVWGGNFRLSFPSLLQKLFPNLMRVKKFNL